MKSTELLGTEAKSFIEWVGSLKEGNANLNQKNIDSYWLQNPYEFVCKAHSIYSQPITEDTDFNKLFKGDWEIWDEGTPKIYKHGQIIYWFSEGKMLIKKLGFHACAECKNINDLITNSPVKLEWNEFEI